MCGQFLVPFWKFFLATLLGKALIKAHIQVNPLSQIQSQLCTQVLWGVETTPLSMWSCTPQNCMHSHWNHISMLFPLWEDVHAWVGQTVFIILVCNAHLLEVIEAGLEWVILHIPAFSRLSPGIMSALGNAKDRFNGQVVAKVSQVHEQLLFFLVLIKTRPLSLCSSASIK